MLAGATLLVMLQGARATLATDFYPLNEGDEYSYEDKIGKRAYALVMRVGKPVKKDAATVVPVIVETGASDPTIVEYQPDRDVVKRYNAYKVQDKRTDGTLLYDDEDKPVMKWEVSAYPVFKLTASQVEWAFVGRVELMQDMTSLSLRGKSKYLGKQRVLGESREVIEVTLEMVGGALDGPPVDSQSVSRYARGVGLYWMKETNAFGKRKVERTRRLLAYSPKKDA